MRIFAWTFIVGSILLAALMYFGSPVTRAIIDPTYTPPYWNQRR